MKNVHPVSGAGIRTHDLVTADISDKFVPGLCLNISGAAKADPT